MKKELLLISSCIMLLFSCAEKTTKERILGVWYFEKGFDQRFLNDSANIYTNQHPLIFDFKENGELIRKRYGGNDRLLNWHLTSDSILTVDSLNYTISKLDDETFSFIEHSPAENYYSVLTRIIHWD